MSARACELSKLQPGQLVDLFPLTGSPRLGYLSRFVLAAVQKDSLALKPYGKERLGCLPRVGMQIGLIVDCGKEAFKNSGIVAAIEGTRIEPVLLVTTTENWTSLNHRSSRRVPLDARADVFVPDPANPGEMHVHKGRVIDVSLTGCRLLLVKPLEKGVLLSVSFALPGSTETLTLMGQVVRSSVVPEDTNLFELGIRYVQVSQGDRVALERWIGNFESEKVA